MICDNEFIVRPVLEVAIRILRVRKGRPVGHFGCGDIKFFDEQRNSSKKFSGSHFATHASGDGGFFPHSFRQLHFQKLRIGQRENVIVVSQMIAHTDG